MKLSKVLMCEPADVRRTWTGSGRNDIDDCGVRYLRGGKMCRRGSEPRRKLVRWQRLMISAGWLARFKSRPRLYPRGILPRICPSLFAALSRHRRTGLPECHEPVNPFVSLTNRLLTTYLWKIVRSSLEMKRRKHLLSIFIISDDRVAGVSLRTVTL